MNKSSSIVLAMVLSLASATGATAQDGLKVLAPSITVNGEGEVQGKPDMAQITVGVATESPSAADAMDANNEAMQQLMSVLKQAGIDAKNIQTTGFNVSPQYRHDENQRQPRIVGYQVENQVQINVRKLPDLGGLLEKLVQSGANRVHGIAFKFADRDKLMNEARRDALTRARQAAELYAKAAGVELGEVLLIREQGANVPMPYQALQMEAMAARAVPIAPGEQAVNVNISVTYAIK